MKDLQDKKAALLDDAYRRGRLDAEREISGKAKEFAMALGSQLTGSPRDHEAVRRPKWTPSAANLERNTNIAIGFARRGKIIDLLRRHCRLPTSDILRMLGDPSLVMSSCGRLLAKMTHEGVLTRQLDSHSKRYFYSVAETEDKADE